MASISRSVDCWSSSLVFSNSSLATHLSSFSSQTTVQYLHHNLGNSAPITGTGGWFLTYTVTLQPFYGAAAAYARAASMTTNVTLAQLPAAGQQTPQYAAS